MRSWDCLMTECAILRRKRTRQPASRIRPLSPEKDARVPASSPWMFTACPVLRLRGRQGRPSADGSPQPLSKTSLPIRTECRVARVGPTHRRIPELCQTCSGIVPRMRLPRTRFCRAPNLTTTCKAIPPPGITKVAQNSPNRDRFILTAHTPVILLSRDRVLSITGSSTDPRTARRQEGGA